MLETTMTEQTTTILMTAVSVVSLASVGISIWNAFITKATTLIIMELQLNLKREFNGRYQTLAAAQDVKDRVKRLEDENDFAKGRS